MPFLWKKVARIFIQVPNHPKSRNTNTAYLYTYNHIFPYDLHIQPYISRFFNHQGLEIFCWNCWPFHQVNQVAATCNSSKMDIALRHFLAASPEWVHPHLAWGWPVGAPRRRGLLSGSVWDCSPIGVFWKKHLGTLKHWNGDKFQKEWFFFPRWIMKNEMEMKMLLLYNPSKLFESWTDKVSSFAKRKSSTPKCLYARGNVIIPWRVSLELPTAVKFQCIQQGGACCGFLFLKYVEDAVLFVVWDGFQNEVHTYRTIQSCAWGFFSVLNAANHTSISSCPNGFWWSRKKQSS